MGLCNCKKCHKSKKKSCKKSKPAYIRLLHVSLGIGPVDIYANGRLISRNLKYGETTGYMKVPHRSYNIRVYPAGTIWSALINTRIFLGENSIYTLSITGEPINAKVLPIPQPLTAPPCGKADIRVVHLSPNVPAVDITLPDGTILFKNANFRKITSYLAVPYGRYDIEVRIAGTNKVIFKSSNLLFKEGESYTIYAIGSVRGKPAFKLAASKDKHPCLCW